MIFKKRCDAYIKEGRGRGGQSLKFRLKALGNMASVSQSVRTVRT